jgi:MSHA pilin protein MshA
MEEDMEELSRQPRVGGVVGNQRGFTLIELIVVIVILGIMAAVAIPRFADIQTEARIAKMQGALGAIKGAAGIAHGSWLAQGADDNTITMEGTTIPMNFGYPDVGGDNVTNTATSATASGIVLAANGLTDYNVVAGTTATSITFSPDAAHTSCTVTYTEPTEANTSPTYTFALASTDCD